MPVIIGLFSYVLHCKVKQVSPWANFGVLSLMEYKQQFLFHTVCGWKINIWLRNIIYPKPDAMFWKADQILHGQLYFSHLRLPTI